jgi:hypothetical protein
LVACQLLPPQEISAAMSICAAAAPETGC